MTYSITTRPATPADAPDLAQLNSLFNDSHDTPEQLAARLSHPSRVETPILAEINGRIVGFAALRLVPSVFYATPHAELTELFVEEPYRRYGVGRVLVAHVERLAREGGADELFVATDPANMPALALYHTLGFEDYDLSLCKTLPGSKPPTGSEPAGG